MSEETPTASGVPKTWVWVCRILLAIGCAAFVIAIAAGAAERAWQAYLLNFLFWTGIAQCGVIFAAAYEVTKGQWSDMLRRMGESLSFFLPVSLALFVVMMLFGASSIFPWSRQAYPGREGWLNVPAVALRDGFIFVVVFTLSLVYVRYSRRRDPRTRTLAPVLLIIFGIGFSLIGFDLVMSLDPEWNNTLFGWYFFVAAFYTMLAVLAIAAAVFRRPWGLERHLKPDQTHDLGRLLFGICLLTGGFFWAQWLVFWYGNLPEEIGYVIRRYYEMPFAPLGWIMTYGGFIVPLVVLLSKPLKRNPKALMAVAVWILSMMWLQQYLWIVPALWKGPGVPFVIELLITAGFLGGFTWGWISYNRRFPLAALAKEPDVRRH
jgi:hypothetical protein